MCASRELNLYAEVSWCVLLPRINKRAERCAKRCTHIQQPPFATILHAELTVTQNAVQTTALQTDIVQRPSSFKQSLSGVVPCKVKCLFGVRATRRKVMSPITGVKSGSARRCRDREGMRVVHRNAAMTVRHQK